MINLSTSSIPVTLYPDPRFKKDVNTSYSGIQIPTNVYHEGTLNNVFVMHVIPAHIYIVRLRLQKFATLDLKLI